LAFLDNKEEPERKEWVKSIGNFQSLAEIYEQAMEEAAELDFTETEYKAFKAKYQDYLYFPEHEDDYGAYLPVSDEVKACLLNPYGRFLIGDQLVEEDLISTYTALQETGQAYYRLQEDLKEEPESEGVQLRSTKQTVYAHMLEFPSGFSDNKIKVGGNAYEFVKDWTEVGNGKKIRVTFGRIYRKRSGNTAQLCWHSEVSFRKKGFLGKWYNYSSETTFIAAIRYNDGKMQQCAYKGSGSSSHDGYWDAPYQKVNKYDYNLLQAGSNNVDLHANFPNLHLYYFKGYFAVITVDYRGMPAPIQTHDSKGGMYAYRKVYEL